MIANEWSDKYALLFIKTLVTSPQVWTPNYQHMHHACFWSGSWLCLLNRQPCILSGAQSDNGNQVFDTWNINVILVAFQALMCAIDNMQNTN